MKRFKMVSVAGMALMMMSCGGFYMNVRDSGPKEIRPVEGKATLVIYRGTSFGYAVKIDNFLNEKFIGQTKGKSYFITEVDPGEYYLIGAAENNSCAKLRLQSGKVYYVLQGIYPGVMFARTGFSGSNPEDFEKDLAGLSYYECCTDNDLPTIDPDDYKETVADFERDMVEDPSRHADTYNLMGY